MKTQLLVGLSCVACILGLPGVLKGDDGVARGAEVPPPTQTTPNGQSAKGARMTGALPTESTSGSSGFSLSADKLERYSRAALDGSGSAAWAIYLHYSFSSTKEGGRFAVYWARIAAENGSIDGMIIYARYLFTDRRDVESCHRARFWIQRARKAGYTDPDWNGKIKAPTLDQDFRRRCPGLEPAQRDPLPPEFKGDQ